MGISIKKPLLFKSGFKVNKYFYYNLLNDYLNEVTPNFSASAFALGAKAVKFAMRDSFEGCVLNNSGGA